MRFIVDLNVGRLTKWLRAMGFDTAFARHEDDGSLIQRALTEGRVIVTKDRKLLERRPIAQGKLRAVAITADHLEEQLRQLGHLVALEGQRHDFTRCLECNVPLEPAGVEEVRSVVPPYVSETQSVYARCTVYRRIYWPGTHWENISQMLQVVANGH